MSVRIDLGVTKHTSVYIIADSAEEAAEAAVKITKHNEEWTAVDPWKGVSNSVCEELERRIWWLARAHAYVVVGDPYAGLSAVEMETALYLDLELLELDGLPDAHAEKERLNCE